MPIIFFFSNTYFSNFTALLLTVTKKLADFYGKGIQAYLVINNIDYFMNARKGV